MKRLSELTLPPDYYNVVSSFVAWYAPSGRPIIKRVQECKVSEFQAVIRKAIASTSNSRRAKDDLMSLGLDYTAPIDQYRAIKLMYEHGARPFTYESYVDARLKEDTQERSA